MKRTPTHDKMEWMRRLVELFKREISYAREIVDYVKPFVNGPEDISEEAKAEMQEDTALIVIKAFRDRVAAMDFMDATGVLAAIKDVQKSTKVKGRKLFWMPLRDRPRNPRNSRAGDYRKASNFLGGKRPWPTWMR
ncbi:hypothetical protein ACW180_05340 [Limosilactobacillus fermentum]